MAQKNLYPLSAVCAVQLEEVRYYFKYENPDNNFHDFCSTHLKSERRPIKFGIYNIKYDNMKEGI